MKSIIIATAVLLCSPFAAAQGSGATATAPDGNVTVTSNGLDVRTVLYDLFKQADKSFVSDVGMYFSLYLTLNNVSFDKALEMICRTAGLSFTIEDGVYIFSRTRIGNSTQRSSTPKPLDPSVLNKSLTIRVEQLELKSVLEEIGKQVGVQIELASNVKPFKINAYLIDTTLRFALNSITQSAKLMYTLTDYGTILVSDPEAPIQTSQSTNRSQIDAKHQCGRCKEVVEAAWKYCPNCGNFLKSASN